MDYRNLEITVNSAKDLKKVNFFSEMDVYVVAMIAEDPRTAQITPVSREAGQNPNWNNYTMRFAIDEAAARANRLRLVFQIKSKRSLGDRDVGVVSVPVKDLIDGDVKGERLLTYAVRTKKGKSRGTLNFSYKLGDKIDFNNPAAAYGGASSGVGGGKKYGDDEPVMAYPAPSGASGYGYPPQQSGAAGYMYPPQHQSGHGYPPPQYAASGYGGGAGGYHQPPQQYGGYVVQPPAYKPNKPPKRMGGMGLGLGAGLLGGLLVGDMISDVGDYGGDYGGGFDGGFDF